MKAIIEINDLSTVQDIAAALDAIPGSYIVRWFSDDENDHLEKLKREVNKIQAEIFQLEMYSKPGVINKLKEDLIKKLINAENEYEAALIEINYE